MKVPRLQGGEKQHRIIESYGSGYHKLEPQLKVENKMTLVTDILITNRTP